VKWDECGHNYWESCHLWKNCCKPQECDYPAISAQLTLISRINWNLWADWNSNTPASHNIKTAEVWQHSATIFLFQSIHVLEVLFCLCFSALFGHFHFFSLFCHCWTGDRSRASVPRLMREGSWDSIQPPAPWTCFYRAGIGKGWKDFVICLPSASYLTLLPVSFLSSFYVPACILDLCFLTSCYCSLFGLIWNISLFYFPHLPISQTTFRCSLTHNHDIVNKETICCPLDLVSIHI